MVKKPKTYPAIHAFAESSFADVFEGWSDAMWPNELVDVEATTMGKGVLARDLVFNHKHLVEQSRVTWWGGLLQEREHT